EMSVQKALKWYRLAAIGGSAEAQNNLGVFYLNGNVVKMWPELAVTLFYISAKGGCASALYNLGMCYYRGYGVERNKDKGREFLEQAAEMGEPSATKILDLANEINNYLMEE
ncbi:MAG: sel1 repeat family protein, partial [Bacteroidaceae bacterium]|nr:sel1 repeat family protein [Bacteroidaceae bacterium]